MWLKNGSRQDDGDAAVHWEEDPHHPLCVPRAATSTRRQWQQGWSKPLIVHKGEAPVAASGTWPGYGEAGGGERLVVVPHNSSLASLLISSLIMDSNYLWTKTFHEL